jgi:hypothetical protein
MHKHGQWNALCQRCGFKYKSKQLRKEWTGLRVCSGEGTNDCFERRHPQESVRGRADRQAPAWVSPEPTDVDVSPGSGNEVTADDL